MEAFLISTGAIAVAELGDKTQIFALLLAARFRRPGQVLLGIAIASLGSHALAALAGVWIGHYLSARRLDWILGLSFLGVAVWACLPEKLAPGEAQPKAARFGALASTALSIFLAEIGDRTQIATVALAAHYQEWAAVVLGSTLGMLIANLPAVLLGHWAGERLPIRLIRAIAGVVFALLGLWIVYRAIFGA
jgi:putative Ca2+/H+ antiporter (TMEM165/GDT1 family)